MATTDRAEAPMFNRTIRLTDETWERLQRLAKEHMRRTGEPETAAGVARRLIEGSLGPAGA